MSPAAWARRTLASRPFLVLAVGVAAVSSAAIWVRYASLPPTVLAFYRLGFSALALWPAALLRVRSAAGVFRPPGWVSLAALAGVSLAAHWAVWFRSLELTSVLSSTVLVTTQPLWVVGLAYILWREPVGRERAGALGLALAGSVGIATADATLGAAGGPAAGRASPAGHDLYGDMLALLAAALVSVYLLVGQKLRPRVSLVPYLCVVYTAGALSLAVTAAATGTPLWGWPAGQVLVGLGMAVVPTLIGHSALNLVVGRLGAATVATAVLGEPVGASLLAAALFREVPGPLHWLGAAAILAGIYRFSARPAPPRQGAQVRAIGT